MGLDAFVPCRCWEQGLTTEPPVPRAAIFRSDGDLDMTLPYDGNEEAWSRFEAWTYDCCRHRNMEYAAEHVGNWSGYRQFQWALGVVGWARFPVLHRILPEANGGEVAPVDAAAALAELADFASVGLIGVQAELYDGRTGGLIATENPAYGGRFMIGPGYEVGIDANGLFVIVKPAGEEVFRAHRVAQRAAGDGSAWLSDLDHPERGETSVPTTIADGASLLLTRSHSYYPEQFVYAVDALTKIFSASVEIDRSVFWT